MVRRRIGPVALCLCLLGALAGATAELEPPDPLGIGLTAPLYLHVRQAPAAVRTPSELPTMPGLQMEISEGFRQQVQTGRHYTTTFRILVAAERPGDYEIPPITVPLENGDFLTTSPTRLRVVADRDDLEPPVHLETEVVPPRAVAGQSIRHLLRIYTPYRDPLSLDPRWQLGLPPEAELSDDPAERTGWLRDGEDRIWRVITYEQTFFVFRPGDYRITGQVPLGHVRTDPFLQKHFRRQLVEALPPTSFVVEELPGAGRPADFTGLVSPLSVETELSRHTIACGEGAVLTIRIHGRQASLIDDLPPTAQTGLDLYRRQADEEDAKEAGRILRYDVVPTAPGTYTIGGPSLSWFDPESRSYQRTPMPEVELTVLPGTRWELEVVGDLHPSPVAETEPGAPTLPPPAGGPGRRRPGPALILIAGLGAILAGLGGGATRRLLARPRRVHRGHRLREAVAAGDLAAADRVLADLIRSHPADAERLHGLRRSLEHRRFGDCPLNASDRACLAEVCTWP